MSKMPLPPTPERNRLRAAVGLIPLIDTGLRDGKLSEARVRQMIAFCHWAASGEVSDPDLRDLQAQIQGGLQRLDEQINVSRIPAVTAA